MAWLRGIFRLSVVLTGMFAIYGFYGALTKAAESSTNERRIWTAMRCGEKFLNQDMSQYTNAIGNIDIGRAGCSTDQFWTNFDEIRETRGKPDNSDKAYKESLLREIQGFMINGVFLFIMINVAGLMVLGSWKILNWVLSGFKVRH
jgi:hypothetical protein